MAALILSTVGAGAGILNRELLWEGDFSTRAGAEKTGPEALRRFDPQAGPSGKGALTFRSADGTRTDWIEIPLDARKFRGLIQVEALVSGRNLKPGGKPYFGTKIMLNYRAGKREYWPEAEHRFGDNPWDTTAFVQNIPENASNLKLCLGLQQAAGEFRVASVKIHRCVEGDGPREKKPPVNREAADIPRGPGTGARYRGVMSGRDLSPAAFQQLGEWGVNLIRYQLNPGLRHPRADISTREKYLAWIDGEIEQLDRVLGLCRKYGIKVVVDVHAGPGNRISAVSSNEIDTGLDTDTLIDAWKRLAAHYRGNELIYGYDILNEPVNNRMPDISQWQKVSERVTEAIRAIDPDTPVIIAAGFSISRFGDYKPLHFRNIVYSPHFYDPFVFTHQKVGNGRGVRWSYPGWINGVYWDREQLRVSMKDAIEFQRKYHVPIFVGEFSAVAWAEGGDRYLSDMVALLEEYGWDWTYHAFREWPGWSLEHEGTPEHLKPAADNPRKRVMQDAFKRNRSPDSPPGQ